MDIKQAATKLGVDVSAPEEEVRAAFRNQALTAHPDTGGSTEAMQDLNNAMDAFKVRFKEGKKTEPQEPQTETYGQQQARSADTNTAEGQKQYNQKYENEGQDRPKEERSQARNDWNQNRTTSSAQRESREREYSYEKVSHKLHTNLYGSFTEQYKGTQGDSDYYSDLQDILERMGNLNVFSQYESVIRAMNSSVTTEQIQRSLLKRAKSLLELYYFASETTEKRAEYKKQMRNCLKIIVAILEEKETISDLDTELQIVKTQLNSIDGKKLWNELIKPTDLNSRLDVIKAILEGKPIEEIYSEYEAKAELGREYLKSIGNIMRFMNEDLQEGDQEIAQAA